MKRRKFVHGALCTALTSFRAEAIESVIPVQLAHVSEEWPVMPIDFIGLSYETGQLYNPDFFSPRNTPLIKAFVGVNPRGVLRLGGHLSNITPWEGVGQSEPKQMRGVRHGIEDYWEWPLVDPVVQQNKRGIISRRALRNLRGFLDAVNWRLIYGLNFACGSAARAADEAEAVSTLLGDRLYAFVVGNEVDGFGEDQYFRAKGYDFKQFFAEYEVWVKAIRHRVPHAQFAGPDTEGKVDTWVREYALRTRGDAVLLTSHFYGMGPASDPGMTAERLLRRTNKELDAQIAGVQLASKEAGGTPYRMDEGNSCFGGGRKNVSDAYASALWAADYILRMACAGFAGVNLHGGGTGIYTPIESSAAGPAIPRPLYYGMQFAQQFVDRQMTQCPLNTNLNITAYQGIRSGKIMLALINKDNKQARLELPVEFKSAKNIRRWELRGPALDAKSGVQFARAPISVGRSLIEVAAYSATILQTD